MIGMELDRFMGFFMCAMQKCNFFLNTDTTSLVLLIFVAPTKIKTFITLIFLIETSYEESIKNYYFFLNLPIILGIMRLAAILNQNGWYLL